MLSSGEKFRNSSIYSVFVRNYTQEGTFSGVTRDLSRIKDLGFDILWLMPIHPVGKLNRKGELGSPYAIADYFSINEEFGSEADFKELLAKAQGIGLKVILDVVFHHTAWDSVLIKEHPEWFYHKSDGSIGNKVGDWSDIADLDFSHQELWKYLLGALRKWAGLGVAGFRCDVAPLIPMEFWKYVRRELEGEGFDLIWLSESVEPVFITELRGKGFNVHSDSETYEAFDILYDYDLKPDFHNFITGEAGLGAYLAAIGRQEYIYPMRYVKLRFLENHDNRRAKALIQDRRRLINFTGFMMFIKGAYLFYNGQETMTDHEISLFDKDPILWDEDPEIIALTKKFNQLKKMAFAKDGNFRLVQLTEQTAMVVYELGKATYLGLFNIGLLPETFDREDFPKQLAKAGITAVNDLKLLYSPDAEGSLTYPLVFSLGASPNKAL